MIGNSKMFTTVGFIPLRLPRFVWAGADREALDSVAFGILLPVYWPSWKAVEGAAYREYSRKQHTELEERKWILRSVSRPSCSRAEGLAFDAAGHRETYDKIATMSTDPKSTQFAVTNILARARVVGSARNVLTLFIDQLASVEVGKSE
jgi:hypothetical protein